MELEAYQVTMQEEGEEREKALKTQIDEMNEELVTVKVSPRQSSYYCGASQAICKSFSHVILGSYKNNTGFDSRSENESGGASSQR